MDPEDEEMRRLLARRILRQLLGIVPGVNPNLMVAGGDTLAAGRPQRDTQIRARKRGANTAKTIQHSREHGARETARFRGVGIERHPPEPIPHPDAVTGAAHHFDPATFVVDAEGNTVGRRRVVQGEPGTGVRQIVIDHLMRRR